MFLVYLFFCFGTTEGFSPEVALPLGVLQGYVTETINGKSFVAFEGVPYAIPPTGNLRFEESEPVEPWEGTLEAKTVRECIQYYHYTLPGDDFVKGNEDCLYLNIYTPDVDNHGTPRDVIIYIHGGAFMFGSGGTYGPYILLDQNVVYVSLNYRLGPLGFLSTEDSVVPGNNGLKDQVLALKWIKKYIKYFGGNPDSITLTGMSAGGASAQFHALSPLSKGLFHRGMSQSGTVLNPWVMVERSLEKCQKIAAHLGCATTTNSQMIACLKKQPAYNIVDSVKLFMPWLYNPFSPFAVVVDKWSSKPFLNDHPYILLKNQKVADLPWIFSHVESEGLYPAADFIAKTEYLEEINSRWGELIPHILHFNETVKIADQDYVLKEIRDFYFGDEPVSETTYYPNLINMVSDRLFVANIEVAAKLHTAAIKSPVYYYYFCYRGAHSKSEQQSHSNKNFGACHGDDTVYVLSSNVDTQTTPNDRLMSLLLVNLWTSFSSTSVPSILNGVNWIPISKNGLKDAINFLQIESPFKVEMKSNTTLGNRHFWEALPFQENRKINTVKQEL